MDKLSIEELESLESTAPCIGCLYQCMLLC